MLTSETKRHIDAARQVLVGVVPNPTSQIDQITNALIYKFMDDMDQSAIKAGGSPSFFIGDLERYAWTRLMDGRLGNQERMNLYSEALIKFSQAKQLPELFRNIFKSAFLPYRSPEVLGLFLKEINYFDYSHPEDLGDGYEYLLSIMSSQGDAGQFRTPRHIIDFIVDVINPTKDDKVLDPACGTGGFLVSSYKHILEQHDGKNDFEKKEKSLTPDDRRKLFQNFEGYDIDPGMVRIAQVNMYLHQFKNPKIFQYDTLGMDDRWNDKFDVILANPPFMSPKGGVRPHSKFSVQSNRSEVLFVDYIMNHLKPKGRAGVIVPEGIIFQSGVAYKQLRKNLIEDGLYAVVSLPRGVFQPYSGVKTSILFFDNNLSKKTNEILFIEILNDGFDLGAQRRPRPDLPNDLFGKGGAVDTLREQRFAIENNIKNEFVKENSFFAWAIKKEEISKTGDYNLSGDRYRVAKDYSNAKWSMVELGEVCEIMNGYAFKSENYTNDGVRIIRITNVQKGEIVDDNPKFYPINSKEPIDKYKLLENDLLVSLTGNVGRVGLLPKEFLPAGLNQRVACLRPKNNSIDNLFLYYILNQNKFENDCINSAGGIAQKNLSTEWLKKYLIPLPPIEVQKEIVKQIEVKQNAIDHAKAIIQNLERERRYFGQALRKLEGVEMVELNEVCEINPKKSEVKGKNFEVSFVPMPDVSEQNYYFEPKQTKNITDVYKGYTYFAENDVLLAKITPCFENGKSAIARKLKNGIGFGSTEFIVLRANNKTMPEWIYNFVANTEFIDEGKNHMTGSAGQRRLNIDFVRAYKIPLPSLETQKKLVAEAEKEQEAINTNKQLIEIMEQKISDVLSEI